MPHLGQESGLYESFPLKTVYSIPLIFSFSLPKITKFLSLIPKISVILHYRTHIISPCFLFCTI